METRDQGLVCEHSHPTALSRSYTASGSLSVNVSSQEVSRLKVSISIRKELHNCFGIHFVMFIYRLSMNLVNVGLLTALGSVHTVLVTM